MRCFICLLVVLLFSATLVHAQAAPRFEPTDCDYATAECYNLIVPEQRDNPASPEIAIAIVRYAGDGNHPTPLVFINGGPGSSTIQIASADLWSMLARRTGQDVILFDPRGVGASEPALDCPQPSENVYIPAQLMPQERAAGWIDAMEVCHTNLIERGIDLTAYTTAATAADINDLRIAFGYEQIDVLGNSYGTQIALVLLRDFPDAVRAAVLDAVVPLPYNMLSYSLENQRSTMDRLFAACAADAACAAAYPDLETLFYETVVQLNEQPATLQNGLQVDGAGFAAQVFRIAYYTMLLPQLPTLIQAAHDGDLRLFTEFAMPSLNYLENEMSWGLLYAIWCQEEAPFLSDAEIDVMTDALHPAVRDGLLAIVERDRAICTSWDLPPAPDAINLPVSSDVPALLISGEFDPVTPPAFGAQVAADLPNSTHVIIPSGGHGAGISSNCGFSLIVAFLRDPAAPLDLSCVETTSPLSFTTP